MPVEALKSAFPQSHIVYEQGSPYAEGVDSPAPRSFFRLAADSTTEGLKAEYFAGSDFAGNPVISRVDPQLDFDWTSASPLPGNAAGGFSVRWTGVIVPPAPGSYRFTVNVERCRQCGPNDHVTVTVDGKQVAQVETGMPTQRPGSSAGPGQAGTGVLRPRGPARFTLEFADTHAQTIQIEMSRSSSTMGAGITLAWQPPTDILLRRAVDAAKNADLVVAMVGPSPNIDGEEMPIHVEGFSGGTAPPSSCPLRRSRWWSRLPQPASRSSSFS